MPNVRRLLYNFHGHHQMIWYICDFFHILFKSLKNKNQSMKRSIYKRNVSANGSYWWKHFTKYLRYKLNTDHWHHVIRYLLRINRFSLPFGYDVIPQSVASDEFHFVWRDKHSINFIHWFPSNRSEAGNEAQRGEGFISIQE